MSTAARAVVPRSDAVHYYEVLGQDLPFAIVANLTDMYAGFGLNV